MNIVQLLTYPNSIYVKAPKGELGGCAIWDLAAVAQMLHESGGTTAFYDGHPLSLNRHKSVYFNDVGLVFAGRDVPFEKLRELL